MVEKIIINPTRVRAYGNIIGTKTSTSYDTYNCDVTGITDTVNGEVVAVMELEYDDTPRSITTLNLLCSVEEECLVGETIVLNCSVVDKVAGATITFYNGNTSIGSSGTNVHGVATLYYKMLSAGEYSFKATYNNINSSTVSISCSQQGSLINVDDDQL